MRTSPIRFNYYLSSLVIKTDENSCKHNNNKALKQSLQMANLPLETPKLLDTVPEDIIKGSLLALSY